MDHISESEWVLALKNGDIRAFCELFDRYGKRLYRFSMGYLKSELDAQEIVQEVFIKIWKNREELSISDTKVNKATTSCRFVYPASCISE